MATGGLEKAQPSTDTQTTRRFQPIGEVSRTMKDIHKNWFNVIRRCQSVGRSKNVVGCAIVSINVVISENGVPLFLSEPKFTLIEPMRDNMLLLDLLKKEL